MKLYSGWEETKLKDLGIRERNPFKLIRILLTLIDNMQRRLANGKKD